MRTTIELSDPIYRRLKDAIAAAEGAWSEMDVAEWERERQEAWATWRLPHSVRLTRRW